MPPFAPTTEWVGEEPIAIERLCARGPALIHFICAGDPGSVRTLAYLNAWHERYAEHGLTVFAVNTPRFPFTADIEGLQATLSRLDVGFPVALDVEQRAWRDYGCVGWPSLFLWRTGGALSWFQFGEGEYRATEEEIQSLLREENALLTLPDPLPPFRPAEVQGAKLAMPTPEHFPGGSADTPLVAKGTEQLSFDYESAGAWISVAGEGELRFTLDGGEEVVVPVENPGVRELTRHAAHSRHSLTLRATPGLEVYCVSFAPGVAG